ncbi:hypothetical protein GO730_32460 [Spirosoma sp. HMF3257]|uniref:PQQ-binding-like beta-propeller repeat protein n=1 Tax=Spirosoma telluris TaxID=2183553 RepID=A0A327NSW2_9BACT|nr:hypothetical protein [Spirosoma telluris]RAI77663.1 hypothetical protein HMF3257_32360 [Spirosoma telluris]
MKKSFILYVALLFLFGCKWEIPAEEKTLKSCQKPTGILATPDAINPKKFSFSLVGALAEVASVSWKVSTGNTTLVQAANANAQAYGYTVATDGTYVVTADVTTTCQDKTTLSVTYTVNTQLPVASSFSLTDPMVHSRLTAVAVANDGTLMAVENSEIKVWNPTTRTLIRTLKADVNPINTVALSPSEAYLVAADNTGKIYVWDWKSGTLTRTLTGHTNAVYKVRVSTDGKYIASLSADKTIRVWDTSTWQSIRTIAFSDNSSIPNAFAVNSSGNYVAGCFYSGNTYYFVMWNFQTGSEVWRQTISYPYGLEFSPDGQQLYLNYYGTSYKYQLWNTATKQLTKEVEGDYLLSLSLDGRYILSNYSWLDTQTFSRSWSKTLLGFSPNYIAISANNQYAARSSYGYVEVLQTSNGTPLSSTFSKHPTLVTSASFSKDNRILAILDYAGLVKTWDMTTGQMLASQTTQNYYTGGNGVALTPDSKYLIISGCSNLYRILNSTDGSLVKTIASSNCSNETVISPDGSFL